jgi:DNA polymerase-1
MMNINLIESMDEAEAFLRWLSERRPILAIDTETGGLDWWRDALRLVQFGDHDTSYAVPWHLWGGLAMEAVSKYTEPITYHNAKFDVRYLQINGANARWDAAHDTRVMAHLLYPESNTSLKPLSNRHLGANSDQWQHDLHHAMAVNKWTWADVPVNLPQYWQYACVDTILTARLYEKFAPLIQADDQLRNLYEMEIAVEQIIDTMERRGVRIDLRYCQEKQDEMLTIVEGATAWCKAQYGFKPTQNSETASQLQRDGLVLTKLTKAGQWSVDESVLSGIRDHPLAACVLTVRKANRYANAYFGNALSLADGDLLHADVNTLGATTGRMSVSRPALQQLPRQAYVRDAFIPRPGNRLVSVDYDQIEMRLFAHYSQEPHIIEAFKQEGDYFCVAGGIIYNEPPLEKKDPRRTLTKNASYANIYGAGVERFALTAHIPIEEAAAFMADYHKTFTGVRPFQDGVIALAKQRDEAGGRAYIRTQAGRIEACQVDKAYKLVNYLVQGTAADIFKQQLIELDNHGLLDRFVLPIHDEVLFDVPTEEAENYGRAVVEVMNRMDYTVPLVTSSDTLVRWGEKYATGEADDPGEWEVEDE